MILCKDVFSLVNADDFIDYKIASSNGFWKVWSEIEEHHDVELRNKIVGEINNNSSSKFERYFNEFNIAAEVHPLKKISFLLLFVHQAFQML